MREIKFRAWDTEGKEIYPNIQNHINDKVFAFGYMIKNEKRFKIMQYTGLKDKSKKEVYVGFIYLDSDGRFWQILDVGFCESVWCYRMKPTDSKKEYPLDKCIERMYYYGNIHENPELIKERSKS